MKTVKKRRVRKVARPRMQREHAMAVLRSFRVIFGSVRQHFREVEKKCGVSGSQLWILQEIDRQPGIGVSDLAGRLAIHQSTCSQLVEKLVRSGHAAKRRSNDDQRRVGLSITRRGRRSVDCAPGPAEGLLPEALGELPTHSLVALQRSLQQLIRRLDLEVEEAAEQPLADL